MACAWLAAAGGGATALARGARGDDRRATAGTPSRSIGESSAGLTGDARAWGACSTPWPRSAGCGRRSSYEGQAAVELEACAADAADSGAYDAAARRRGRRRVIDPRAAITAIAGDIAAGAAVSAQSRGGSTRAWPSPPRLPAPRPPSAAGSTSSCCPAACSRIACCWSAPSALLGAARPAGARARAASAERRRHQLRSGRCGGRPRPRRRRIEQLSRQSVAL